MTPSQAASDLDHPCKEACSGWKQGYDKGHAHVLASPEVLALVEALKFYENQDNWTKNGHLKVKTSFGNIVHDFGITALDALAAFSKAKGE